ncbi:MAG: TonB-dependent receptor [Bacteroidota bacterium]
MRGTVWLACVMLLLTAVASAQSVGTPSARTLQGIVTDAQTRDVLPGASVYVPALDRGTATDLDGHFDLFGLPADTITVRITSVGFLPVERVVDLREGNVSIDVRLTVAPLDLGAVDVTADASLQRLTEDVRAISTLEGDELDALRGSSLGETLSEINGVSTLSTGPTIAKPVVRGLHSDRVLILDNGVQQEGQQWGGEHAPEIDPFAPGRIEVIKGAAGVEYGAGAIGGVIRLQDRPLPETPGVGGRFSSQAFTNSGQGAASLFVEGANASGTAWRVRGSLRRAGDARTPDFVIRNSAFAEASGEVVLGLRRGGIEWEARARRFSTELGIYKGSHFGNARNLAAIIERGGPSPDWNYQFSYEIDTPKQVVTHDVGSLRATTEVGWGELEIQGSLQRNHRQEFDAHGRFGDPEVLARRPAFDLTLFTNTLDARLRHRQSDQLFGTVGASWLHQINSNGASGYLIPNFSAITGGLFGHQTWLATENLSLEAGTRLDVRWQRARPFDYSIRQDTTAIRTYGSLSGTVGALYTLGEHWSLSGNVGTAWRAPGINELYAFGVHHGTARFEIGTPTLVPERSLDASATLRHESALGSAEINAYANRIEDYIYLLESEEPTVTIRGTFPTFNTLQDDVLLRGIDATVALHATGWLTLGGSASVLRADNLDLDGPLYGVPSDRFGARLRLHRSRLGGLLEPFAEAEVRHTMRMDRIQPGAYLPAPPPDAYTLTDLRFGGEVIINGNPLRLSLGVNNLFDVRYRDILSRFRFFIDEPGRNVTFRVTVPFGSVDV